MECQTLEMYETEAANLQRDNASSTNDALMLNSSGPLHHTDHSAGVVLSHTASLAPTIHDRRCCSSCSKTKDLLEFVDAQGISRKTCSSCRRSVSTSHKSARVRARPQLQAQRQTLQALNRRAKHLAANKPIYPGSDVLAIPAVVEPPRRSTGPAILTDFPARSRSNVPLAVERSSGENDAKEFGAPAGPGLGVKEAVRLEDKDKVTNGVAGAAPANMGCAKAGSWGYLAWE